MIALGEVQKRWLKRIGYPFLGLVVFVFAVHYTFPYGRLEARLAEWAGDGFDVSIEHAGPGWLPGTVIVKGLTFRSRPEKPGDKVTEFVIDKVELDIGLFAAIGGTIDIELDAQVGAGKITGRITSSKSVANLTLHSKDLPLATVPGITAATGGVPIEGALDAEVKIKLPKGKWKEAEGKLVTQCNACTIGDGIAKIRPMAPKQANAFSSEGFTLPRLKLGSIGGRIEITKGIGRFQEFQAVSPDGELYLEGDIRFEDPFSKSQVTAYMRFKSSEELKKREPVMQDIEALMAGNSRRPDGYHGVRITGPMSGLRYVPSKVSPVPQRDRPGDAEAKGRGAAATGASAAKPANRPVPTPVPPDEGGGATPAVAPPPPPPVVQPIDGRMPPHDVEPPSEDERLRVAPPPGEDPNTPPPAPNGEVPHDTDPDQPPQPMPPPEDQPAPPVE